MWRSSPGESCGHVRVVGDQIGRPQDHCFAGDPLKAALEARHECLGLAEGKKMTARKLLHLQPQALAIRRWNSREKPVIATSQDGGRNVRPVGQGKRVWNSESAGSSSRDDISSARTSGDRS